LKIKLEGHLPRRLEVSQKVLIVDDDASTCEMLQTMLHAADIQALTLTDSGRAVEILRNQKFDAVFVDVNMPAPDGMEVTREIRSSRQNQKTPVIMMTGDDDPTVVARGFKAGVNFFVYKPLIKDRILNLARVTQSVNQLERRRFHRVAVKLKVEVQWKDDNLEAETIDMSLNGMLVRARRTFPVGTQVKVRLFLSSNKAPIAAPGTVARIPSADTMGIHLDKIDKVQTNQLQELLLPLIFATAKT
jgi:two-component system, chemotaxis family, chemotaxis protein CheY